jgi:L,D-transpeptidase catalytic domain
VISPEQLAEALDRIHPRDRELLSLSLRRRVPDEALARLYECESTEVARRRAQAIERLADEMELQRGEDLGAVLKALLDAETWSAVSASVGEEFALEAGGGRLTTVPPPDDAEITARGPTLTPVPVPLREDAPEDADQAGAEEEGAKEEAAPRVGPEASTAAAPPPPIAEPPAADTAAPSIAEPPVPDTAPPPAADPQTPDTAAPPSAEPPAADIAAPPSAEPPAPDAPPVVEPPTADTAAAPVAEPAAAAPVPPAEVQPAPHGEPVLEMLGTRDAPDPPRRAVPLALFGLGIASLVGAAGVLGATQFGETSTVIQAPDDGGGGSDNTRHFIPATGGPLAAPFPTDPESVSCYSTAYVPRQTVLYREPGGRKRLRITAKTEWGSPRVLGVLEQRGDWLGVQAAELRNGEIAWVRRRDARVDCVTWSLHADLSKRTLFVRRDGRTVRKMRVAIGRKANPTPKGRFTVTDKLRVTDPNSPYGCCVLALSGHQTDLPEYWPGGDRLAVHATSDESSIGQRVSLGCLRTQARRARWLIETVPLGAPVFIRA